MLHSRKSPICRLGIIVITLGSVYYTFVLFSTNNIKDLIAQNSRLKTKNEGHVDTIYSAQESNISPHQNGVISTADTLLEVTTRAIKTTITTQDKYVDCKRDLDSSRQNNTELFFAMKNNTAKHMGMFIGAMSAAQTERQKIVEDGCKRVRRSSNSVTRPNYEAFLKNSISQQRPTIYYSSKYKVMFCEVAKVGCTQFKLALIEMENLVKDPYKLEHESIHATAYNEKTMLENVKNITKVKEVLDTYFKIMIVRDPFQRLLSAYNDKLAPKDGFYHPKYTPISEAIRKKFHPYNTTQKRATFENFIDYLLYQNEKGRILDLHWDLYTRSCDPCVYKYNYIARLETIEKDARYLEDKLGLNDEKNGSIKFFHGASDSKMKAKTSLDKAIIAYGGVPLKKRLRLFEMYKPDFEIFGYPYPINMLQ